MNSSIGPIDLNALLSRWKSLREQGQAVVPEELCRDCPQLLPELLRHLQVDPQNPTNPVTSVPIDLVETVAAGGNSTPEEQDVPPLRVEAITLTYPTKQSVPQETASHIPQNKHLSASAVRPIIPGFEVGSLLGVGGMGEVYEAKKIGFNITYALKIIRRDRGSSNAVERFRKEAEAMTQLDHPHIVRVFEVGETSRDDHGLFLTMKLLKGGTLASRIHEYRKNTPKAVELMIRIAGAVGYLHAKGLLHRDIKPGNVLFDERANPYLSDFGLVKYTLVPADNELASASFSESFSQQQASHEITQTGSFLGTPAFMALEQLSGGSRPIGPAADVFALGVMLYELTVGHRPFRAGTIEEMCRDRIAMNFTPPSVADRLFDRELEKIILKSLALKPEDRYPNAGEFARALTDCSRHLERSWWSRRRWLAAGAVLVAGGTGGWTYFTRRPLSTQALTPLQTLQRDLAEKGIVKLIQEDGTLRYAEKVAGELSVVPWEDGSIRLTCGINEVRLLELATGLKAPFRFDLEFRQEPDVRGFVGIYFGRSLQPATNENRHCMLVLQVFDQGRLAPDDKTEGSICLQPANTAQVDPKGIRFAGTIINERLPIPPERWRKVSLELLDDTVKITVGNKVVFEHSRALLIRTASSLGPIQENFRAMTPSYRPEEGLGLIVYQTTLSIRNPELTAIGIA